MLDAHMFAAGVLKGSGQDLGCSPTQRLPLSLGAEHLQLTLLLLSQRLAVTHLEEEEEKKSFYIFK